MARSAKRSGNGCLHLQTTLAIAGLGNADVRIEFSGTGGRDNMLRQPRGARTGRNTHETISPTISQTIPGTAIKNGNLKATLTTPEPTETAQSAGCPNPNYTAVVANVDWSSATVKVFQPADATTPVLTFGPVDPVP